MKKTIFGMLIVLGALAYGAVKMYVIDPKTVSTTEEILELYYQSRDSLPPLPSPVNYQDVMDQLTEEQFDFIASPSWAYIHNGGTYYLSDDSKYAKEWNLPMTLLAYEDLASGKVALAGISIETEKLQSLAIVDAPEFSKFDEKTSVEGYLMAELWPRRIIWTATLKSESDAWNDLTIAESLSREPVAPMMMSMSMPASPTNLVLAINSTNTNSVVDIEIGYPDTFTNRVEVFATTNLVVGEWEIVSSPITTTGSSTVVWIDTQASFQSRFYRAGNADLDADLDGIVDAREMILYGTNPYLSDSDEDGVDDGDELGCETDPTDPLHYCVTLQGTVTNSTEHTEPVYAMAALVNLPAPPNWFYLSGNWMEMTGLQQVSISNGTFVIDHLVVDQRASNDVWYLVVGVYQDITTNEVLDYFEPMHFVMASVTNHAMDYDLNIYPSYADKDHDDLLDLWEYQNGLSGTNRGDAYADLDGDWIDSFWEYRLELDPNIYNTNNYAFADAAHAVDSRIAGKDPADAIHIFNTNCYDSGIFVRNTNCWAADLDLTCISPWNDYTPGQWDERHHAGTLISPRHAIFAEHFHIPAGNTLRFVDATNGIYDATIASVHHVVTNNADLTVAVLDSDVPTNRISFAKILPANFTNYLGHIDLHVPSLCLDQEEKALIHDLGENRLRYPTIVGTGSYFSFPSYGDRKNYYDVTEAGTGLIAGDSGNPAFIILNDEPVLITVWTVGSSGIGTAITRFKDEINAVMNATGYSLSEIDLSDYDEIPLPLR